MFCDINCEGVVTVLSYLNYYAVLARWFDTSDGINFNDKQFFIK